MGRRGKGKRGGPCLPAWQFARLQPGRAVRAAAEACLELQDDALFPGCHAKHIDPDLPQLRCRVRGRHRKQTSSVQPAIRFVRQLGTRSHHSMMHRTWHAAHWVSAPAGTLLEQGMAWAKRACCCECSTKQQCTQALPLLHFSPVDLIVSREGKPAGPLLPVFVPVTNCKEG